jgi:signal transduction histidine kinase
MHSLAAHGVRLEQKLTEAVVGADEEMLWHVFSNVIDNAIKYRAETNPSLSVIMKVRGAEVTVRISDNGVGLSPEEQERVFERFFQSSSATEGIGLGLFICKNMLESMGGSIGLSSEGKGKGVTVDIRLPLG